MHIPFYSFLRNNFELAYPPQTKSRTARASLFPFFIGVVKGTVTQADRLEDLGDNCNVKMRSQAGLAVSPACDQEGWASLGTTRATLRTLKGVCATATMGRTFLSFALIKSPPSPPTPPRLGGVRFY